MEPPGTPDIQLPTADGARTGLTFRNGVGAFRGWHAAGGSWGLRWMQGQSRACGQREDPSFLPSRSRQGVRLVHLSGSHRSARARGLISDICPGAALSGVVGAVFAILAERERKIFPKSTQPGAARAQSKAPGHYWEHLLQVRHADCSGPPSSPGLGPRVSS